jgi:hypothetical protein
MYNPPAPTHEAKEPGGGVHGWGTAVLVRAGSYRVAGYRSCGGLPIDVDDGMS